MMMANPPIQAIEIEKGDETEQQDTTCCTPRCKQRFVACWCCCFCAFFVLLVVIAVLFGDDPCNTDSNIYQCVGNSTFCCVHGIFEFDNTTDTCSCDCNSGYEGTHCDESTSSGSSGGASTTCLPPGTLVLVYTNASAWKAQPIESIQLGDVLVAGGPVIATMQLLGYGESLFEIDGAIMTGTHAVRDPADGVWRHAQDVVSAKKLDYQVPVVHNVITEKHRIVLQTRDALGDMAWLETADFMEVEDSDEVLAENLAALNLQTPMKALP